MQLNLSGAMLQAIVHALRRDVERGERHYSCDNGDNGVVVTNEEALELFEEALSCEGRRQMTRRTERRQ